MRAQIKSVVGLASALLVAFALTASARTMSAPPKGSEAKGKSIKLIDVNAWTVKTTNWGPFMNPVSPGSGGYWRGLQYNYVYGAGLWVGALDAGGTPHVSLGYYPNNGGSEFGPVDPISFSYANWATNNAARTYMSDESADQAAWKTIGAGTVKSIQDGYAVYSDLNPEFTFTGEQKVGVLVKQWSYAWNYADNNDIVFFYFRVFNKSQRPLTGVYLGPCFDADIGSESGTVANDRTSFDISRNLAMQYQNEPESGWPSVGVVGVRYFESPINNTGQTINVVDNQYSRSILPDSVLGMTSFKIFTIAIDPATDADRYLVQQGYDYTSGVMDAYDELGAATPGDKRFLMSSGPFNMAIDDSVSTCLGVMCANDTTILKNVSDVAQDIYNNHFELATPPVAPEIAIIPGDKYVRISWGKISETTPDPYYAKIDTTKRYYTYFPGTWKYLSATARNLVTLMWIKTGTTTKDSLHVPGTANPPGGTDTVYCFYNQRAMYSAYDFQGYLVYRAKTKAELTDPAKRQVLGGSNTNVTTGASGAFFDKVDSIQIVRDLVANSYATPETTLALAKYDTLGTDRGLVYTLVDSNVINNFGWWYGISAYDYQPNVYFTRKCPTTLASNPAQTSKFVAPIAPSSDYRNPVINYVVNSGDNDTRRIDGNGTVDYNNKLLVGNPNSIKNATYTMRWQPVVRTIVGTDRIPCYNAFIYDEVHTDIEGFTGVDIMGLPVPAGWTFTGITGNDTAGNFGAAKPAITFDTTGDMAVTPRFLNPQALSFWIKGNGTDAGSKLQIEGYNGTGWTVIDSIKPSSSPAATRQYTIASPITQVRFIYTKSAGSVVLDDVSLRAQMMVDSTGIIPAYGIRAGYTGSLYYGTAYDELSFGGVIFQPSYSFSPTRAAIASDSLQVTEVAGGFRTYPRDSCMVRLDASTFTSITTAWMWRGSDYEIRWRDTTIRATGATADSAALTCTVWDITNNVEVPFQGGVRKDNMTKQAWCFNPTNNATTNTFRYIYNRSSVDNWALFISGVTVYFNRGGTRRLVWANRPETGDVWRINCTGPRTPFEGQTTTFTTFAAGQVASLSSSLLDQIMVVPNPYLVRASWDVSPDYPNLYFTNLPAKCTIRIYNMAGDLVQVLKHETTYAANNSSEKWNLLTPYNKRVASGLYIYHVDAPGIGTKTGKFAVIK